MKRIVTAILAAAAVFGLAGCSTDQPAPYAGPSQAAVDAQAWADAAERVAAALKPMATVQASATVPIARAPKPSAAPRKVVRVAVTPKVAPKPVVTAPKPTVAPEPEGHTTVAPDGGIWRSDATSEERCTLRRHGFQGLEDWFGPQQSGAVFTKTADGWSCTKHS